MSDFSKYIIKEDASVKEALIALNKLSSDTLTLFIIDKDECIIGSLTDGDIRRKLIEGYKLEDNVKLIANRNFIFVRENELHVEKIKTFKSGGIYLLPVLNKENNIVSILNLKKKKSILPIDAVLMAGGKGERLRPLTEKTPKPLLKVGDKAIIDYNVGSLLDYGIEKIYVTTNYLAEQIEDHFRNSKEYSLIECIREPKYLGTIGSLGYIKSLKNDTILLMNSDLFTNINYEDFFLHFQRNNADVCVATIPYTITIPYGVFDLNEMKVKRIREKPTFDYYVNSGIYLIKKELLRLIPENTFFNATDFLEKIVSLKYDVVHFPFTGYWIDIGKHEDYKKAQDFVKYL